MLEVRYRTARTRPLDLGAAFPGGSATRPLRGKAESVPTRWPGAAPRDRVETRRAFSRDVHGFPGEAVLGIRSPSKAA